MHIAIFICTDSFRFITIMPLSLAMSFSLPRQTMDFHPLETYATMRPIKNMPPYPLKYSDMSPPRLFLRSIPITPKFLYPGTLLAAMNTSFALLKVINLTIPVQKICPVPFLLIHHTHYLTFPVFGTVGAFTSGALPSILFDCTIFGYAASNASAPY